MIPEEMPCQDSKMRRKRLDQWAVLEDVDDVVPIYARNITCWKSSQKGAVGIFCIRMWLALFCLFSVIVSSTLQQVRNTWDVFEGSLISGIEAACSGPLRRLRPITDDYRLIEPR